MKCFSVGLIIGFSFLVISLASPVQPPSENKEQNAIQECNATNPVQQNIRQMIGAAIAVGDRIKISQEEKCHLNCFLQKVGFFDQNGNIKGPGLVKYTLSQSPELAKYSDVIIAQVFQISRSTKGFNDQCQKAFVAYHQFTQGVFELFIAEGLQSATGIKDAIVNLEHGQQVDQKIRHAAEQYLGFFDVFIKEVGKEFQQNEAQVHQGQSQASQAQSQGSSILQQQAAAAGSA